MEQKNWTEKVENAKVRLGQMDCVTKIREHPIKSTAIALGVGAVTGAATVALMRNRCS